MGLNWRKPVVKGLLTLSGSNILKYLHKIEQLEKQPQEVLKKYQDEKLKKILFHARHNVPYYNDVGKDFPILTKSIIREQGKNLYSKDYKKRGFYHNSSGGSTGEPVKFIQDKEYYDWTVANKLYYKRSFGGQDIGEKELRLWGSERDILLGKEKLSIRIKMFFYNRKELNSFKMSKDDMIRFVKIWNQYKPKWVEAYVQSIYEFAKFVKNKRIHSPKGILTSAGTLYPEMKELIEKTFKCPVFNRYGSREVGDMACSDRTGKGLRLSVWNHYIEILDKNLNPCKKGETGKIYVTTLNNYSMPLIRYDIGDVGVAGDWGYLESVKGRDVNLFRTKKGDLIDGEFFTHLFYHKSWVNKFQVVQKDYELIKIKIKGENNIKDMKKIETSIKKVMGNNCKIEWKFVNNIPPLKSGKFMYTISEVAK